MRFGDAKVFAASRTISPANQMYAIDQEDTSMITLEMLKESKSHIVRNNAEYLYGKMKKFEKMSLAQLKKYSATNVSINKEVKPGEIGNTPTELALKEAWLLAAEEANKRGYTCSATLVSHSVLGIDYIENKGPGGLFYDKIIKVQSFNNQVNSFISNKTYGKYRSVEFTRNDNADLYYSLHFADVCVDYLSGHYFVNLKDRYDFNLNFMGSLFATIVNDWAALCQAINVLEDINVKVSYTIN